MMTLFCYFPSLAQSSPHYVYDRILAISDKEAASTSDIAAYIKNTFPDETDKVRAAYIWVVHNIEYDTDSMYAINWNMGGSLKITESLRRRKGVCENFAGIFTDIVTKAGLTASTIDGYTKQANFVNRTGHTWSAVLVRDGWYLFDPTWDKDRKEDYNYFMLPPSSLSKTHIPFDPIWQFSGSPISHREFQGKGESKSERFPNHLDSVKAFMRLSELDKLEATARRMDQSDNISDLLKNRKAFLRMKIATVYEERDMDLYNAAVRDVNAATEAYNKYNNKTSAIVDIVTASDRYILILEPALDSLNSALNKIAGIGKYMPNYQYDPASLRVRILEISEKIRWAKPVL